MKIPKATARLAKVVEQAGPPEPVTLWVNPRNDKRFQAAIKQKRVLTVKQETVGTKKDFGIVGFHQEPNVSYWIFPKSLQRFEDKRIIGIDYGLLQQPKVQPSRPEESIAVPERRRRSPPPTPEHEPPAPPEPPPPPPPPKPVPRFRVVVRCVSTIELPQEVKADNRTEAKTKAVEAARELPVDFTAGTRSWTATSIERLEVEK